MKQLVENFPSQVKEAIEIAHNANLTAATAAIKNVIISGLGGSGIGGTIVSQLLSGELTVPVVVNKDYSIPSFCDSNTLFIASSYSGNTEETLEALAYAESKGAQICAVTSGGKLLEIAQRKNYNVVTIPGGFPPRSAFGYSSTQLFYVLHHYGLVGEGFKASLAKVPQLLIEKSNEIRTEAMKVAKTLMDTIPAIYSDASIEGVGVRFRQQINENSKMLCWHHVLPEMNHNELVGWADENKKVAAVYFRNKGDYYRTQERMAFSIERMKSNAISVTEIWSQGSSNIEQAYYHIHVGDFVSVYIAELRGIDAVEVDIITNLKNKLAEI